MFKDIRAERSGGKYNGWKLTTKVESQYLAQLYAVIGIRASEAAQQLLGKAESLKSVGGLEQFVREFMLDEPDSLARLPEALKQIDPLVQARELLSVAQRKRKILGDIEAIQVRYTSESSDLGIIDLVDQPLVRAYTDHVRLKRCPAQIETLDADVTQLDNEHTDLTRQLNLAKAEGDSLTAQINGASTNVGPLQAQVAAAEAQAEEVSRRRAAYEELVGAQGIEPPESADEFWNLREELTRQATEMLGKLEWGRDASTDAEYAQKSARIVRDNAAKELKRVEHVGSALPESAVPCARTSAPQWVSTRLSCLMSPSCWTCAPRRRAGGWRSRRCCRPVGLRLLVPDQHYAKVLRFVNETNMRGR